MKKFPSSLCWCSAVVLLATFAGCEKKAAPLPPQAPPLQPSPSPTKIVSAEPTSFDAVAKHLDAGGGLYFYLSTEGFVKAASRHLSDLGPLLIDLGKLDAEARPKAEAAWKSLSEFTAKSGLKEISGFGVSSIALEPGYYQNKFVLHRAPANGDGFLWKVYGSEPNALDFISYLPATTALATSGNMKLSPVWDALNQEAASNPDLRKGLDQITQQFQQATELSLPALLASLGPNYSLIVTLDESRKTTIPAGPGQQITIPEPALGLFVQVQDDVLINRIDKQLSAFPMITKNDEGDLHVRSLSMPLPFPFLRPVVAWKKGILILSSSEPLVREMLDVKAGKKPGLAAQPGFQKLIAGLPKTGGDFSYVSAGIQKVLQDVQTNSLAQDKNAEPAVQKLLAKINTLSGQGTVVSVTEVTPEGWIATSHGATGPTQIAAAGAVIPAAILAAVAVPAVTQARIKAEALKNARQQQAAPEASPAAPGR